MVGCVGYNVLPTCSMKRDFGRFNELELFETFTPVIKDKIESRLVKKRYNNP